MASTQCAGNAEMSGEAPESKKGVSPDFRSCLAMSQSPSKCPSQPVVVCLSVASPVGSARSSVLETPTEEEDLVRPVCVEGYPLQSVFISGINGPDDTISRLQGLLITRNSSRESIGLRSCCDRVCPIQRINLKSLYRIFLRLNRVCLNPRVRLLGEMRCRRSRVSLRVQLRPRLGSLYDTSLDMKSLNHHLHAGPPSFGTIPM